ncbi:MAG: hypothetical protein ACOYIN_05475 [Christensenellales bacterium]|jgi:Gpi18-like mannosyltransferase|nr:hypothetical protein [Eubacteriales bacterium]
MKKHKKFALLLIAAVIIASAFLLYGCNDTGGPFDEELVLNGNFEDFDDETSTFTDWQFGKVGTAANTKFDKVGHTLTGDIAKINGTPDASYGKQYLRITNSSANVGYAYQTIAVTRGATYRITLAYYQNAQATPGSVANVTGAHLSFLENTEVVLAEQLTYGKWTEATVYVKPRNSDYLTLCLRVGAEDAPAAATARFDKVSMVRVQSIPKSATVTDIVRKDSVLYNKAIGGILFETFIGIFSAALVVGGYVVLRRMLADRSTLEGRFFTGGKFKDTAIVAAALIALAFAVRMVFASTMYGFGKETAGLLSTAQQLIAKGLHKFYTLNPSTLYSPGELYILSIIGGLGKLFKLETSSMGFALLLKLPAVIADTAVVAMLFFFGKKYVGPKLAALYSVIYALLPVALVLSGVRGSFDSILAALLLLTFILLIEKKYIWMFVTVLFSVLLSLDAMAVVPLILAYLGYLCYKEYRAQDKGDFKKLLALTIGGTVAVFVAFWLLSLPFAYEFIAAKPSKPFYILGKYTAMMKDVDYFVSNNFNLYGMVGMNNKIVNNTASIFNLIFILVLVVYVISLYLKNRNRLELMLLASFTFAIISVFTLKHTETYLFLSLGMLLAYIMLAGEKRLYFVFFALSLLNFLNIAQLMNISGFVASKPAGPLVNFESIEVFYIMMSVFAVLVTLYYGYLTYMICNNGQRKEIPPMRDTFLVSVKKWFKSWKRT